MCLDNGVGGHRSWQVRQPAAQSRLRSSARGAAPPALCLLVFRPWDGVGEDGMGCALVGST